MDRRLSQLVVSARLAGLQSEPFRITLVFIPSHRLPSQTQECECASFLCCFLRCGRRWFHVSAEFLAHGGEHLLREGVLLARTETSEQRCREHIDRNRFVNRRLDCPSA